MIKGIMLNEDSDHFFHSRFNSGLRVDLGEIERFIDQYDGTQVTDFMICVTSRISSYPSKSRESLIDKYLQKMENGQPVDYTQTMAALAYDIFVTQGIDMYAVWIERLRRIGINPWISFRMNDCHCNADRTHWLLTDFFHENPQLRRMTHHEPTGYYDRNYNYARDEIAAYQLAYIEETLDRYDPYGIELDWQREMPCFPLGGEYAGIERINDFMREIDGLVLAAERRRGHQIKVAARVHADPRTNLEWGFDPFTWVAEGIVDVLVPTPRWETADTDIPVELWTRCLHGCDALLAPGIEVLLRTSPDKPLHMNTNETVAAQAAQYLSMGADRIYLFNYMDMTPQNRDALRKSADVNAELLDLDYDGLLRTIGDEETAVNAPRRHLVTYHDMLPPWRKPAPQLPLRCDRPRQYGVVRVRVGRIPENADVRLVVGASSGGGALSAGDFDIYVNSAPVEYKGVVEISPPYTDFAGYVFAVRNNGHLPPFCVIEIATTGRSFAVDHIEVRVELPSEEKDGARE